MISLPRKWAKKYGLVKGDELELTERGKDLLLSTDKAQEASETIVERTQFRYDKTMRQKVKIYS